MFRPLDLFRLRQQKITQIRVKSIEAYPILMYDLLRRKGDDIMTIEELKARKKQLNLSTKDLAYLAELPLSTVSKIFTGETKNPSYLTIEKLDATLNREEMLVRVHAYEQAMKQYFLEHPEDAGDQNKFEAIYRRENHLNHAPIPYAVSVEEDFDTRGHLALQHGTMTVSELADLGEQKGYQLIDGHMIVAEMAGVLHQRMVRHIGRQIEQFILDNGGKCEVFDVGVNVFLDEDDLTLVIPDIAVVCNPSMIDDRGIQGAPDWIVEVVSASTRKIDYHKKLHKYMDSGVREYWIVDIDRQMVTVCVNGEPMQISIFNFEQDIPVMIYDKKLLINMVISG